MNQKTVKLIRKAAALCSKSGNWKTQYRDWKENWKQLPRPCRHEARIQMRELIEP